MSRMIEVTKLQDGTYDVNPNATPEFNPIVGKVWCFGSYPLASPMMLLDEDYNSLYVEDIATFDFTPVKYVYDGSSSYRKEYYTRGRDFDNIEWDGDSSNVQMYKDGETTYSLYLGIESMHTTTQWNVFPELLMAEQPNN